MSAPAAHAIELRCAEMHLKVRPDLGASIEGLWLRSLPVLRSKPGISSPRESGCYPLVPYSNRIAHGRMHWLGQAHALQPLFAREPHSIHGTGWRSGWDVLAQSEASLVLQYQHTDIAGWPFPFVCVQSFLLTEEALTLSLHITNQADGQAPVGLGWHPYLVKRHGAKVKFSASGRWEMGQDKLPTQQLPYEGLDECCDDLCVDNCFDGWSGVVEVRDDALHTRIESSLNRMVVFTDPARDFIALEPVSHVNNALGQVRTGAELAALGVQTLAPGQSYAASMRISTCLSPIHSRTLEMSS